MKRLLPVVLVGLAGLPLGLAGCQDLDAFHYSNEIRYGVRTDPLVLAVQPGDLGEETYDPDRPGVLPLMRPQDVLLPGSPMRTKGEALFEKQLLADPTLIPTAARDA